MVVSPVFESLIRFMFTHSSVIYGVTTAFLTELTPVTFQDSQPHSLTELTPVTFQDSQPHSRNTRAV